MIHLSADWSRVLGDFSSRNCKGTMRRYANATESSPAAQSAIKAKNRNNRSVLFKESQSKLNVSPQQITEKARSFRLLCANCETFLEVRAIEDDLVAIAVAFGQF
jgi:hypothetical protein